MGNVIKPRNEQAPNGTTRIINSAESELRKSHKRIGQRVIKMLNDIMIIKVPDNEGGMLINRRYEYLITTAQLMAMSDSIGSIIAEEMPPGDLGQYVASAFNLGTTQAIANLENQVELPYSAESKIMSQAHRSRVTILQNRTFEYMQNLSADMKANLNRVLSSGILAGDSPYDVARQIRDQIGIPEWNSGNNKASYARAIRIARTEMNVAHRAAGWAQDEDSNELGIKTKLIWFSAMSTTTRRSHAIRHGHLYTRDEVRDFYSRGAHAINCKCAQRSVVLNEDGEPSNHEFVKTIQDSGKRFFKD